MMHTIGYWRFRWWLRRQEACRAAQRYVATSRDLYQCLAECDNYGWLVWLQYSLHLPPTPYEKREDMMTALRYAILREGEARGWGG